MMATVTLTLDEYEALRSLIGSERESEGAEEEAKVKPKRKVTAANRAYSKAFRKVQSRFKLKNGSWKKDGFKNCCKAAHKMCK
jgi:hypothetical protein